MPNETIGVGTGHDFQLFDRAVLYSDDARFVLAGIVNRMDRAFASPESCGEVRLIYRLARTGPAGEDGAPRPLPMTLNIVLKARGGCMTDAKGAGITCAGIARRWLDAGESTLAGADLAARLLAPDGPLDLIRPENIDRIETNLQIVHVPKSAVREFRTDYLLKVFRFDSRARAFEEAPHRVRVNAVCPGLTLTPFHVRRAGELGRTEQDLRTEQVDTNLQQRWADAREVAYPILWLASDEASFVTASTLMVDGGSRV